MSTKAKIVSTATVLALGGLAAVALTAASSPSHGQVNAPAVPVDVRTQTIVQTIYRVRRERPVRRAASGPVSEASAPVAAASAPVAYLQRGAAIATPRVRRASVPALGGESNAQSRIPPRPSAPVGAPSGASAAPRAGAGAGSEHQIDAQKDALDRAKEGASEARQHQLDQQKDALDHLKDARSGG
jgi:hypothetical protein